MGSDRANARAEFAVVIAGGGTGGHLYPGIAVAREILRRMPNARVSFAGTARGLEARVLPREGFELDLIRSAGLKGKSAISRLQGLTLLGPSALDAWRVLSRRRPHAVVGVGGYSSGPVVALAALRGIATMVLEQNATPGLTNRMLAPFVRAAAVTYDEALGFFRGRGFVAGNPVRAEFFVPEAGASAAADSQRARPNAPPGVLILGGSQGAHAINLAVVAAAAELVRRHADLRLVHQTGERDLGEVRTAYEQRQVRARAESFLDPVVSEVMSADLVVCRAGATTLAELAAVGKPALLVPLPTATDDHQRKNADVLARAGAAVVVDQSALTGERLAREIGALIGDPERLAAMGKAMRSFARPDAAARIVDRLVQIALGTRAEGR